MTLRNKKRWTCFVLAFIFILIFSIFLFSRLNPTGNIIQISSSSNWEPPIGIPTPDFGISESNYMYSGMMYDYSGNLGVYKDAGNGPYTHYIDKTSPQSTDTNNPYGDVNKPRKTIPSYLTAGSVVELHGGNYDYKDPITFVANGTIDKPVFIRGVNANFTTRLGTSVTSSNYVIVENLNLIQFTIGGVGPHHHIVLRNSNIGWGRGMSTYGAKSNLPHHDLVFFNNTLHDGGDMTYALPSNYNTKCCLPFDCDKYPNLESCDQDVTAMYVNDFANNVWFLENTVYNFSGSGFQAIAANNNYSNVNHIYVGRNHVYRTTQSGLWSKQASDIIFSQNIVHDIRTTGWSPSKCFGFQYGPNNIWFLYNTAYNCENGFMVASDQSHGVNNYFIGNVAYNNHIIPGVYYKSYNPEDTWMPAGISIQAGNNVSIIGNTLVNNDAGIIFNSVNKNFILNNLVYGTTQSGANFLFTDTLSTMNNTVIRNNIFYQPSGNVKIRWGSSNTFSSVSSFQSDSRWSTKWTGGAIGDNLELDPKFRAAHDFNLQSNSPAIDSGIDSGVYQRFYDLYGLDIKKDIGGRVRPKGNWDRGAYEFASTSSAVCGNGQVESGEACDGGSQDCYVNDYLGKKKCNSYCAWDNCLPIEKCGDGIINGDELCDLTVLNNKNCSSFGFLGGKLNCFSDCSGFDKSGCLIGNCVDADKDGLLDYNETTCLSGNDFCPWTNNSYFADHPERKSAYLPDLKEFNISDTDYSLESENFTINKEGVGKVVFTDKTKLIRINGSGCFEKLNLSKKDAIKIESKKIFVNSTLLPELNKPVVITFFNIDFTEPKILRDGIECSDCKILNYSNGTLVFNVSGFSEYEIVEGSTATVSTSESGGGSSGGGGESSSESEYVMNNPVSSDNGTNTISEVNNLGSENKSENNIVNLNREKESLYKIIVFVIIMIVLILILIILIAIKYRNK